MAQPLQIHQLRLQRVARYLLGFPGEVWHYDNHSNPNVLDEMCDTDWAGDQITKRSMSCVIERYRRHIQDVMVEKQKPIALSSGEAECSPMVKAAAASIQSKAVLEQFYRNEIKIKIHSDSSAARGIVQRQGPGRLRQLRIKEFWIQEFVRNSGAEICKIGTKENWADIGTKALTKARAEKLLSMMHVRQREDSQWSSTDFIALVFFAMMGCVESAAADEAAPEAALVTVTSREISTTDMPETAWSKWLVITVFVYAALAALTLCRWRRWWRSIPAAAAMPRGRPDGAQQGALGRKPGQETLGPQEESKRKAAENLREFTHDQVVELLRLRSLPYSRRTKSELIDSFMSSTLRASDKQINSMWDMKRKDYRLKVVPTDVDSKVKASGWITSASLQRQSLG